MQEDSLADLKSQGMVQLLNLLVIPPRSPAEEALSIDQRLDVPAHSLTHVSVTLVNNLYPYRWKELETKIDIHDKSLQQQFETI